MKNELLKCKCVDMTVDGQGIAKADNLVVFVKGMIVGEEAIVKIISEKKNYAFGIIDELLVRSPHRIDSECKVSYKCGGCDYRFIDYPFQLELKKSVLDNTLRNFNVLDIIPDDDPYYYRNKVQVPLKDHKLGFYRKYSNDVVEFEDCLIESKTANEIIIDLRKLLVELKIDMFFRHVLIKHAQGSDEIMLAFIVNNFNFPHLSKVTDYLTSKYSNIRSIILNLNTRDDNVILGSEEKVVYGNDFIYDNFDGLKFKISLKSFYQVNYRQMLKLYDKIRELSMVGAEDSVLDLYCGIGTISLYLSRFCKEVTGVEIVKEAVDNAIENAQLNNIGNARFFLDDAGKNMSEYLKGKDILILDPPRKGITTELIDAIKESDINRIVYVSCNPATLDRDLELLKDTFSIGDIQPVDMFPWTVHVETCVLLTRKN